MGTRWLAATAALIIGLCAFLNANSASAQIINPVVNGTLILDSHVGDEFLYEFRVGGTTGYHFNIPSAGKFVISGMSGVTNAAVGGGFSGAFTASYTATTATFEATSAQSLLVSATPYGEFDVFSTAPDVGTVAYSVDHTSGLLTGTTVDGPMGAAVPELSTWAMMAFGFAALGLAGRQARRDSRTSAA